jgi:hypothetical protein
MGFRFRKRLKLFPGLWINLSKKGRFAIGRRPQRHDQHQQAGRERYVLTARN